MQKTEKRIQWIDFARGIVMLLVIWGHLDREHTVFFTWTNAVKLPGFLAISGFLLNVEKCNNPKFIAGKVRGLLIPYYALGGISVAMSVMKDIILTHEINVNLIISFLTGREFWFIPCLFCCMVYIYIFAMLSRGNLILFYALSGAMFLGSIIIMQPDSNLPFRFDLAMYAQFFVCVGNGIRKLLLKTNRTILCIVLPLVYVVITILFNRVIPNYEFDINRESFSSILACTVHMFVGIVSSFSVFLVIGENDNIITSFVRFVGRNTLCYFVLSFQCMNITLAVIRRMVSVIGIDLNSIVIYFTVFAIMCVELAVFSMVINRWLPFLLGRKQDKI